MVQDLFDRTIRRYVVPISELREGPGDCCYFFRKNGSFVFSQGYSHPKGGLYCKIIYFFTCSKKS